MASPLGKAEGACATCAWLMCDLRFGSGGDLTSIGVGHLDVSLAFRLGPVWGLALWGRKLEARGCVGKVKGGGAACAWPMRNL